ncbi:hypothetical protein O6H91_08G075900 [Diphasiastrum complanatum]|uniref:Uncharacterized protein n=1 Tax=Diphasiastrum complanatum TaxID=34168 RepID=A0ACC2CZ11_DIPCM|nr:hypothetical protein O6H91_08G075900 [Diphasiastrum complanatum]
MKAVAVAHVKYEEGDGFGHLMAWASLFPLLILAGFVSLIIFRRELQTITFFMGIIISGICSEHIKSEVKQARPLTCEVLEMCDSHGWPSNHSQFMTFFSIYITYMALFKWSFSDSFTRGFTIACPWPFAIATMYSRIYLGYHTTSQVVAGFCAGLIMGSLWFLTVNMLIAPLFPSIENTRLARALYIRDSSHIPNVMLFEYNNSIAARKQASQAAESKSSKD